MLEILISRSLLFNQEITSVPDLHFIKFIANFAKNIENGHFHKENIAMADSQCRAAYSIPGFFPCNRCLDKKMALFH